MFRPLVRPLITLALLGIILGCPSGIAVPRRPRPHGPFVESIRYNEVQQKSAHNAYERKERLLDQLVYHRIRSLELDIHTSKRWKRDLADDWYVYHSGWPTFSRDTSCVRLSDCLEEIAAFRRDFPEHEVLTLFIDLKDDFGPNQSPENLDRLIERTLAPGTVYTPSALAGGCPGAKTLQEAVGGACGWPGLGDLSGKVIVALTGPDERLDAYTSRGRQAFVARGVTDASQIASFPDTVFFNLHESNRALAQAVDQKGLVSRAYFIGADTWSSALDLRVHHVAVDEINTLESPGVRTHNDLGWPFECLNFDCSARRAMDAVVGMAVRASEYFAFAMETERRARTWSALISTSGSHAASSARGCLMARADAAVGAPQFAVCRSASGGPATIEWRDTAGGPLESRTVNEENEMTHLRLRVWADGRRDCAGGEGSTDGRHWRPLGAARCFDTPLLAQGVAASAREDAPVKLLFGNVTTSDRAGHYQASMLPGRALLEGLGGEIFDGPFPVR